MTALWMAAFDLHTAVVIVMCWPRPSNNIITSAHFAVAAVQMLCISFISWISSHGFSGFLCFYSPRRPRRLLIMRSQTESPIIGALSSTILLLEPNTNWYWVVGGARWFDGSRPWCGWPRNRRRRKLSLTFAATQTENQATTKNCMTCSDVFVVVVTLRVQNCVTFAGVIAAAARHCSPPYNLLSFTFNTALIQLHSLCRLSTINTIFVWFALLRLLRLLDWILVNAIASNRDLLFSWQSWLFSLFFQSHKDTQVWLNM